METSRQAILRAPEGMQNVPLNPEATYSLTEAFKIPTWLRSPRDREVFNYAERAAFHNPEIEQQILHSPQ